MQRPACIGNYVDFLDEDNASYPGSTELLSIGSAIGRHLGLQKIGIHIELLPSGRRTSWPHAEKEEEEFGFVLEGNPQVWLNGETHQLKAGDFVAFPAGTGMAHVFINNTQALVKLLVGGERSKPTNQIHYPLHPKRNEELKERFWKDVPPQNLGSHDGKPDALRENNVPKWGAPTIDCGRFLLRPLTLADVPDFFKIASNPKVTEFLPWTTHTSLADTEAYIKVCLGNYVHGHYALGIYLKSAGKVVGMGGAFRYDALRKCVEIGGAVAEEYWGQGLMPDSLRAVVDHCWKNSDVNRIQAVCNPANKPSFRMLEKVGMTHEGTLRNFAFDKGKSWDMEMFSLIRES